ncbi:hypothetical protein [Methylobacterium mesophilicum]|uniref:hypothetical protein n=1 Tax=Methylobacterium mesophilicum TaxID=39956 RepID=UPI002F32667E
MRKALGRPVQRARSWYLRYGRLGAQRTPNPAKPGPHVARGRTLEDWARFGGGLLAPEAADGPQPETRASAARRAAATPISPPG